MPTFGFRRGPSAEAGHGDTTHTSWRSAASPAAPHALPRPSDADLPPEERERRTRAEVDRRLSEMQRTAQGSQMLVSWLDLEDGVDDEAFYARDPFASRDRLIRTRKGEEMATCSGARASNYDAVNGGMAGNASPAAAEPPVSASKAESLAIPGSLGAVSGGSPNKMSFADVAAQPASASTSSAENPPAFPALLHGRTGSGTPQPQNTKSRSHISSVGSESNNDVTEKVPLLESACNGPTSKTSVKRDSCTAQGLCNALDTPRTVYNNNGTESEAKDSNREIQLFPEHTAKCTTNNQSVMATATRSATVKPGTQENGSKSTSPIYNKHDTASGSAGEESAQIKINFTKAADSKSHGTESLLRNNQKTTASATSNGIASARTKNVNTTIENAKHTKTSTPQPVYKKIDTTTGAKREHAMVPTKSTTATVGPIESTGLSTALSVGGNIDAIVNNSVLHNVTLKPEGSSAESIPAPPTSHDTRRLNGNNSVEHTPKPAIGCETQRNGGTGSVERASVPANSQETGRANGNSSAERASMSAIRYETKRNSGNSSVELASIAPHIHQSTLKSGRNSAEHVPKPKINYVSIAKSGRNNAQHDAHVTIAGMDTGTTQVASGKDESEMHAAEEPSIARQQSSSNIPHATEKTQGEGGNRRRRRRGSRGSRSAIAADHWAPDAKDETRSRDAAQDAGEHGRPISSVAVPAGAEKVPVVMRLRETPDAPLRLVTVYISKHLLGPEDVSCL